MQTIRKLLAITFFISITSLIAFPATAQQVELAWDPSDSEDVAGYKIYYKADSPELPLDGIEALEGPSPVDVGDVTTFTLTELPEGSVYYFRATAYNSAGYESILSNLAASAWIPALRFPEKGESIDFSADLIWSAPPSELDIAFNLKCTTEAPQQTASLSPSSAAGRRLGPLLVLVSLCALGSTLLQTLSRQQQKTISALGAGLALCLSTATCGGGGGGSSDGDGGGAPPSDIHSIEVDGITDNYYTVSDLEEGKTYYWQVTAVDSGGNEYQSDTWTFVSL